MSIVFLVPVSPSIDCLVLFFFLSDAPPYPLIITDFKVALAPYDIGIASIFSHLLHISIPRLKLHLRLVHRWILKSITVLISSSDVGSRFDSSFLYVVYLDRNEVPDSRDDLFNRHSN